MIRLLFVLLGTSLLLAPVRAQGPDPALSRALQTVYLQWRTAMIQKNLAGWRAVTASHRQIAIRNRILSERRNFVATLFNLPVAPPDTRKLKLLDIKVKGVTANAYFFGPVDFGVEGAQPPDNLLVLSFAQERGGWKYDTADYVNLAAIPNARKELAAGRLTALDRPEFAPKGEVERPMVALRGPAKYITKVYVYCPGREVQVSVNKVSRHLFQNAKEAEIVIGGAKDGRNELQFGIKTLPGGQDSEPMTIRIYLLSEVQGVKPIKIFQYQVEEKGKVKPYGTEFFNVTPDIVKRLRGGR